MNESIFVIDVMPFLYRGHFVFLKSPRRTTTGINTSSLSVFATSLATVLKNNNPAYVVCALDSRTPTFRHELDPRYKAQRQAAPEDILAAIPQAIEFAEALNLPILQVDGFEADDLLGTFAAKAKAAGIPCYLVTPDKDAAQLVDDNTRLIRPGQSRGGDELATLDVAAVCERWQLASPAQMIDYLAMTGDSSDNIPGIPGVGEKTATALLKEWGSLDAVLEHASEIKGKLSEKVINGRESALLSRTLATIRCDVPIKLDGAETEPDVQTLFAALRRKEPDTAKLKAVLQKYEFNQIARRLLGDNATAPTAAHQPAPTAETEEPVAPLATIADTPHSYILADTEDRIQELCAALAAAPAFAFDTETAGLDTHHDRLVGMSFAVKPGQAWYVPVDPAQVRVQEPDIQPDLFAFAETQAQDPEAERRRHREAACTTLKRFEPYWTAPDKIKIGHNIKFDLSVLRQYGFTITGEIHDTLLASYVLDASGRHGMDELSCKHLHYRPIPIEQLIGERKKGVPQKTMDELTPEAVCDYAAEDADVTLRLEHALRPLAQDAGLERALRDSEEPLVPILVDMEYEGVHIDTAALKTYSHELEGELLELETKIKELAGTDFNIASPKQLGEILFDRLQLDPHAVRTPSGQYATDEGTLTALASSERPIIGLILEHRACSKLKNTYVDKLPLCIDLATGRVHTTFSQALTDTGRLSSSDPNLQNIPIRSERGQRIRAAFTARDDQHVLVAADYSQIELRVMAAMSGDEALKLAFQEGADIHTETASKVFGKPAEEVTREERAYCKMVNFGIIYGISAFGLGQRLGIPQREAKVLIDTYFAEYPGVKTYMDKAIADAREHGYATTLLGRRRSLPDIASRNVSTRNSAERNAINTPIQGTAADIVKLAMIRAYNGLKDKGLKAKMVLQIHDELLFDVPQEEVDAVTEVIREAMTGALDIGVPLDVDIGVGPTWLDAH